MLETELAENLSAMVTFTNVRLTNDLREATVYYSVLGQEQDRIEADRYLQQKARRIRSAIGRNLRIRHIPELRFKFDPSVEEGLHIERLLNEIKNDQHQ